MRPLFGTSFHPLDAQPPRRPIFFFFFFFLGENIFCHQRSSSQKQNASPQLWAIHKSCHVIRWHGRGAPVPLDGIRHQKRCTRSRGGGLSQPKKKEKREQRQQRNYLRVINSDSKAPDTDLLSLIRSFKVIVLKEVGGGEGGRGGDVCGHVGGYWNALSNICASCSSLSAEWNASQRHRRDGHRGESRGRGSIRLLASLHLFFYRAAYVTLEKAIINDNNRIDVSTIVD